MKSVKTTFGLFFAVIPILYCAGLAYYLAAVPGRLASMFGLPGGATDDMTKQLGPTVLGLGAFGLLFAFAFIIRIARAASRAAPKSAAAIEPDDEPFDADAALARYLARKAAGGEAAEKPATVAGIAPRGFGRKTAV